MDECLEILRHVCVKASIRYGLILLIDSNVCDGYMVRLGKQAVGSFAFNGNHLLFKRRKQHNDPTSSSLYDKYKWDMTDPSFDISNVVQALNYHNTWRKI